MSLKSLIATGTKLWLDSIEPDLVRKNRALGRPGQPPIPSSSPTFSKAGRRTTI